jgi:hypothetical protein
MLFKLLNFYRAFHGFGQAKFVYAGSIRRLKPCYNTAQAASKKEVKIEKWSKSTQK